MQLGRFDLEQVEQHTNAMAVVFRAHKHDRAIIELSLNKSFKEDERFLNVL